LKRLQFILFHFLILSYIVKAQKENNLFPGEKLTYKIHIGFIHAAEASITTSKQSEYIAGKKTHKIEVSGKTVGIFNLLTPVEDYWSAYLTTDQLLPVKTEFRKRELRYKKQEIVHFYHEKEKARIISPQNNPTDKIFEITQQTKDLIGGYFFLRDQAINKAKSGQKFTSKILMDNQLFDLWVIVKGNDSIENDLGKKNCIRASMVLPKNNLFEDKDAIRIWITDDAYQIPYKIEVGLKFGQLSIDLVDYHIDSKKIY
jgi:hypothetical protein